MFVRPPSPAHPQEQSSMSFVLEYLNHAWQPSIKETELADLKAWNEFIDAAERERQRDRIIAWRDRVAPGNYAVNEEESEYYVRTAGFVWRFKDPSGKHKARNHQYLYNLEMFGHNQFSRRDKSDLEAAQRAVAAQVAAGQLGPLSPLSD